MTILKKTITCIAKAHLPTQFGPFELYLFHDESEKVKKDHIAIVKGSIKNKTGVLTRIHSECLTGDVLSSLRCDCEEQLHYAMEAISNETEGVLLYLRQEGRGIGLLNKILAYELQDRGLNTITANKALGLPVDSRDYSIAVSILDNLKVKSIRLLTNNPKKLEVFASAHIPCIERIPIEVKANPYNNRYLEIKRDMFGHYLTPEKSETFNSADTNLALIKFVYFFDETRPYFELSNFGEKGEYENRHGDKGEYAELVYQSSKFYWLEDQALAKKMKEKFFAEVKMPADAFQFMRRKLPELNNQSINNLLEKSKWMSVNENRITNKELEMLFCILNKFDPVLHPELFKKLITIVSNNQVVLVEANPNDPYWGYQNVSPGEFGLNKLGLMLTAIAQVIRNQSLIDMHLTSKDNINHIVQQYQQLEKLFRGFNFHLSIAS